MRTDAKEYKPFLDYAKGIAIILVVFAHCIQCGNGAAYSNELVFFNNVLYKIIYSFHMPLLMIISGYLMRKSIEKKSLAEILKNKFLTVLLPVFVWTFIVLIRKILSMSILEWIDMYMEASVNGFWFLWAVFLSSLCFAFIYKVGKNKWYWHLGVVIVSLLTPDAGNMECYKFMYVCYLAGYYYDLYVPRIKEVYILLGSSIFWLVLISFYGYESYIYTSGWTLLGTEQPWMMMGIDVYRCVIGVVGSVFVIELMKVSSKFLDGTWVAKFLSSLGKCSLGIYIISTYANTVLQKVTASRTYSIIVTILESVIILVACWCCVCVIRKSKWLSGLLFGGIR